MRSNTRISDRLMRLGTLDLTQELTQELTLPLTSPLSGSLDVLELDPLLYFDAASSMLDSDSNQAGFLERVATFKNLGDGPSAIETVGERQPLALPLIEEKGYLLNSGIDGNYADLGEAALPLSSEFTMEIDFYWSTNTTRATLVSQYSGGLGRLLVEVTTANEARLFFGGSSTISLSGGTVSEGLNTVRVVRLQSQDLNLYFSIYLNGTLVEQSGTPVNTPVSNVNTLLGKLQGVNSRNLRGAIRSFRVYNGAYAGTLPESPDVDIDFTSPTASHGAASFTASTGETVTINTSGRTPSKIIQRPCLRFDGAGSNGDRMFGVFSPNVTEAHAFLKFAVNGDSFEDTSPSVLAIYRANSWDTDAINFYTANTPTITDARSYFAGATRLVQSGGWNDDNGTIVVEVKGSDGDQHSIVDGGTPVTDTQTLVLDANKFRLSHSSADNSGEGPIDVEQIIMFDRVIAPATANDIYREIK